jgi:hypothetical protein
MPINIHNSCSHINFISGMSDFSIETEIMRYSPATPNAMVAIIFTIDGTRGEGNEWLTLELIPPAPSALLSMPSGEGVFFRNLITLTIQDSGALIYNNNT